MVVYYINKVSENLADYPFSIKEGDICMLYDGEQIKTIYIDSERDKDSIWRDFKFVDSKSLKSYQFPKSDCIICAPLGNKHAIGNSSLLTQLSQECKGEWLLDFLNETTSVLSGFVDYWDLGILRRFTGDADIRISYESEDDLSEHINPSPEINIDKSEDDYFDDDVNLLSTNKAITEVCLAAMACLEDQIDKRSLQILDSTLRGDSYANIACRFNLTQERIRQIVNKTLSLIRSILEEQRWRIKEADAENKKLKVQIKLLREDIQRLNKQESQSIPEEELEPALLSLLETPIKDIAVSVRASNMLYSMGISKFSDIPQISSYNKLLSVKNSGRKTAYNVTRMLNDFHLQFGMSYNEIVRTLNSFVWYTAQKRWIRKDINIRYRANSETKNNSIKVEKESKEEATIVLTEEMIDAARTPNGGFTKSQLAAIGIGWPPPQGWISDKVGTKITQSQLDGLNRIDYVIRPTPELNLKNSLLMTYREAAFNSDERKKMEAILQAMVHFYAAATPHDIARVISQDAWGDESIDEDTVDSFLKRLPEVEYIQWGKYILKSKKK